MSRFVKKPTQGAEWKSETNFRLWARANKIDIIRGQPLICMACGIINSDDMNGRCYICCSKTFIKADFQIGENNVLFVDGSIHDKGKVEEHDIETDKQLIMLGVLPTRIKSEYIDRALAAYKKK